MDKRELNPLWKFQPQYTRYSISWRMGTGEDYAPKWWKFFESLSDEEQKDYISKHPEPEGWEGFYTHKHPNLPPKVRKEIEKQLKRLGKKYF